MRRTRRHVLAALALLAAARFPAQEGAAEATPSSGATPTPTDLFPGVVVAAARAFRVGRPLEGRTLALVITVSVFTDSGAAEVAFHPYVARLTGAEEGLPEYAGLEVARAPDIGSEAAAFAGVLGAPDGKAGTALVFWRDGPYLFFAIGVARPGDEAQALSDVAYVARRIAGRRPTGPAAAPGPDGMRRGGVWDLLPGPHDLPEGFMFVTDVLQATDGG
jgi:hypothetical protein